VSSAIILAAPLAAAIIALGIVIRLPKKGDPLN
jgi:hypothetical protein